MFNYYNKTKCFVFILLYSVCTTLYSFDLFSYFTNATYNRKEIEADFFPKEREANNRNVFIFDPKRLAWAVYNEKGKLVGQGKASGGRDYCPDTQELCRTVVGEFTVFRREDKDCTSNTFPIDEGGGAPMPHCMFFHQGYAIHGSDNVPKENVSHGCIRVTKHAAKWMNKHYMHEGAMVVVLPYA